MLTLKAPAKINWFLYVNGLRKDGYHDIKSLIQKISLYDILTFIPSAKLTVITEAQIPVEKNLVYKAAALLQKECGLHTGAEIHLKKNIPVAAGLGGGSSDAASTLVGLNKLWSLGLSPRDLFVFAEQLGSDVPFFLYGPLALVEGRGEKITNFNAINPFAILLVNPHIKVSTRWAYQNLDVRRNSRELLSQDVSGLTKIGDKDDNIKFFINAIGRAELLETVDIFNDLEAVTVLNFPVIAEIKEKLLKEGALFSLMSGSGPTVFGVFTSAEEAERASREFRDHWAAVVQTITEES